MLQPGHVYVLSAPDKHGIVDRWSWLSALWRATL